MIQTPASRLSLSRTGAIMRHEFRILFRDPSFLIVMIAMPVVVMAFMSRVFRFALVAEGYQGANGSEQAVPGITVMFSFFLVGSVGFVFFREHGWFTWDRLRASRARPFEIMAGKVAPVLAHAIVQQALLLGFGVVLFGLKIRGSLLGLTAVMVALGICLVTLGTLVTAITKTAAQQQVVSQVGTMFFAGLGGAMAPVSSLPGWARAIAPGTPSYWAMKGFRTIVLDAGGLFDVAEPILILLAFSVAATVLSLWRFRFEETKLSWA